MMLNPPVRLRNIGGRDSARDRRVCDLERVAHVARSERARGNAGAWVLATLRLVVVVQL